ncbi:hypothetical protein ACS0TY_013420 [Phlomoides rotata]
MRKLMPETDIVANPHINLKIHVWKKEYGALSNLLSKSGIGWNSTTSMIEIEDEGVWNSCRQADPHVKGLWYKTWLYYPHWIEIFGKDRTTGENAVDPIDLVNELHRSVGEQEGETGEKYVPLTPEFINKDTEDNNICKPTDEMEKSSSKGKKRKSSDPDLGMLVESLGEFMKYSKVAMGDLKEGIDHGSSSSTVSKQLNGIMKGIVGLKLSDKLKVCDELVHDQPRLDFFPSLLVDEQEEFVWMLFDVSFNRDQCARGDTFVNEL